MFTGNNCDVCGNEVSVGHTSCEAVFDDYFRSMGWRKIESGGYVCPDCFQRFKGRPILVISNIQTGSNKSVIPSYDDLITKNPTVYSYLDDNKKIVIIYLPESTNPIPMGRHGCAENRKGLGQCYISIAPTADGLPYCVSLNHMSMYQKEGAWYLSTLKTHEGAVKVRSDPSTMSIVWNPKNYHLTSGTTILAGQIKKSVYLTMKFYNM
jgi:hypothetical protein